MGLVSSTSNQTVNVQNGAQIYPGVVDAINAVSLTGTGTTVNNAGRIDPSLLPGLVSLASGLNLSNAAGSTVLVNNLSAGQIMGTSSLLGANLLGLGGIGLVVQNGAGGTTTVNNTGLISGTALLNAAVLPEDMAVIALRGGARNVLTNNATGMITGRVAMQASTAGNTFTNAGTVTGSINLGAGAGAGAGANTFNAITGSVMSGRAGVGVDLGVLGGLGLAYVATGIVNGGTANNGNTLNLHNTIGGGVGLTGSGTIDGSKFVNFSNLNITSGTWSLTNQLFAGGTVNPAVTLNGGLLNVDSAALTGATITANGGGLGAAVAGATVSNGITLGTNGLLVSNSANGLVLSGVLTGTGALTKTGTNNLTLSGANDFSGGTTLAAGTLTLGNAAALGTQGLNVTGSSTLANSSALSVNNAILLNGANLTVNSGAALALSGAINGTGSLTKTGTADLTLSGANNFGGGLNINAGKLILANAGATGGGTITAGVGGTGALDTSTAQTLTNLIQLNGNLTLTGSNDLTLAGKISGTGGLNKAGTNTLTLNGANDFTGNSTLGGGTLILQNTTGLGSGQLTLSANSNLDASGLSLANNINLATHNLSLTNSSATTLSGVLSGTGSLNKSGTGDLMLAGFNNYSGGTTISTGRLIASAASLGSGAIINQGALELNQSTDETLTQSISGNGSLTKTGAGTLTLTADSSAFTGSTQLDTGALALTSGAVLGGSLAVGNGATLIGSGTVGSTTLASGATIALGSTSGTSHTYGTLSVNGDLTFQAGSIYQVHADPGASTSDRIAVSGRANLAGGVLHVGPEAGFEAARTYTILTASQVSNTFDTVTSNYAYLDPKLRYGAEDVSLLLQRKANQGGAGTIRFADLAQTGNQAAVANGIESLPSSSALFRFIESLPNGTPPEVFNSVSGESHASIQAGMGLSSRMFGMSAMNHLHSNLTANLRPGTPIAQSDGPLPTSAWPSIKTLPTWAELVGHWQTFTGNSEAGDMKQDISGLFAGTDTELGSSGWRLGGALGYTRANAKVTDRSSKATLDNYSAAVYGGKSFGASRGRLHVMGGLSYTWHDINSERQVAALSQNLTSDYRGSTTQLFAELGYALDQYDKVHFEPFAGINLGHQRMRGFKETGGFVALRGSSSSEDLVSSILGMRAHSDFKLGRSEGRLHATLGWRHAFGDVTSQTTMAFEGGQNFTVAGVPLARNTAVVGLAAELEMSRRAALVLGYKGEFGTDNRDHSAQLRVNWAF